MKTELKDLIFHRDQVIELSTCNFNVLHLNSTNIHLTCFYEKKNHVQQNSCKARLSFDVNGALVRISLIFGEVDFCWVDARWMLDAPPPFKELFLFFLTGSKTDPRRFKKRWSKNVIELNKISKTSHLDTSVHHHHPRNLFSEKLDREFVF